MKKRINIEVNDNIISVLNVPFPKEKQGNFWYCFPFSVKMVVDFYRNTESYLLKYIPEITISDMIQRLNVHPFSGIKLSPKKISQLNEITEPLVFKLRKNRSVKILKNTLKMIHR